MQRTAVIRKSDTGKIRIFTAVYFHRTGRPPQRSPGRISFTRKSFISYHTTVFSFAVRSVMLLSENHQLPENQPEDSFLRKSDDLT